MSQGLERRESEDRRVEPEKTRQNRQGSRDERRPIEGRAGGQCRRGTEKRERMKRREWRHGTNINAETERERERDREKATERERERERTLTADVVSGEFAGADVVTTDAAVDAACHDLMTCQKDRGDTVLRVVQRLASMRTRSG